MSLKIFAALSNTSFDCAILSYKDFDNYIKSTDEIFSKVLEIEELIKN